jgi:hypothetical protein
MKAASDELVETHHGKAIAVGPEGAGASKSLRGTSVPAASAAEERENSALGAGGVDPRALDPFHLVGHVIGPTNLLELVACPCCQQCFDDLDGGIDQETLVEPLCIGRGAVVGSGRFSPQAARHSSILTARESDEDHDDGDHDENGDDDAIEEEDDLLPGVLGAGVHYVPKSVLVEGWLHKKGTGKDWLGSRAWKARWARLALAKVDGYESEVPIMLIYWYPSSSQASTVILLDDTVVLSLELEDKDRWNSHRFEIRHVQKQDTSGSELVATTRTFSAPQKGRDAWVYAISQALLSYEKQKDKHRKLAQIHRAEAIVRRSRSPDGSSRSNSPTYDEVWTGDRFVTVELRKPCSPPSSPRSPSSSSSAGLHQQHPLSPNLPRPKARRPSGSSAGTKVAPLSQPRLLRQPSF